MEIYYIIILIDSFSVDSFLADNLVVELQVDVRVFVPACLAESVFVELLQPGELLVDEVADQLRALVDVFRHGQTANIDDVVAYARHEFDAQVAQYVYLFNLVAP